MAALKPWYKVVEPRQDLREGRPLDASEFAVHLDKVREGTAPAEYSDPEVFFARTYLTTNLLDLGAEVLRRLNGIKTETSAIFNLATQFGGGKTHALTLLYHLGNGGPAAKKWVGVDRLLEKAGVQNVPHAAVATFVGTDFDSITGRGGDDGTPLRRTPWGEIAWQLGGKASFDKVRQHEEKQISPGGDVIEAMLPRDKPSLILIDELLNYISRNRKTGLASQLYDFLQSLSVTASSLDHVVLAVSIPASELEMTVEDHEDYNRFKKMLDKCGKPIVMSADMECSEIIRRRLFDWPSELPDDARRTAAEYAKWIVEHRDQLPKWFPVDSSHDAIEATYPLHPVVLSVFERKWQSLPRFQQTRGILRLLALWVSRAYQDGAKGGQRDPLICLGSAPLEDPQFRTAVFEQLGEQRLEVAVTTDICGKKDSHAVRLDLEAVDTIKKAGLHRRAAKVVFFESNGGQAKEGAATVPEVRLALGEPGLDVGNVETVLEALTDASYYMRVERNRYRFGLMRNLNKALADRSASIDDARIDERAREEIEKAFDKQPGVELAFFPGKSGDIADRPVVCLVVMKPDLAAGDRKTVGIISAIIREHGASGRTFKSALLFAVSDGDSALRGEARRLLAWQEIQDDSADLDAAEQAQLAESIRKAQRDLREAVWRTYRHIAFLTKNNEVQVTDLGLVHSSQSSSLVKLIVDRLCRDDEVTSSIKPELLVRSWPGDSPEWSTKAVRDAFYASPRFPRLLDSGAVRAAIARGVSSGLFAYANKVRGRYEDLLFQTELASEDVEIAEDTYILTAEEARKHIEPVRLTTLTIEPERVQLKPGEKADFTVRGFDQHGRPAVVAPTAWTAEGGQVDRAGGFTAGKTAGTFAVIATSGDLQAEAAIVVDPRGGSGPGPQALRGVTWTGEIPAQKWMNFYTKVLAKYATSSSLKLTVTFEVAPEGGMTPQRADETRAALQELGLSDDVKRS